MAFEVFKQALDPEGQNDYMLPLTLNAGEQVASATASFVDATSSTDATGTTPTVVSTTFGQISGNSWGVTVWLNGNSAPVASYYLRFRGETNSTPARKFDKTIRLEVRQT